MVHTQCSKWKACHAARRFQAWLVPVCSVLSLESSMPRFTGVKALLVLQSILFDQIRWVCVACMADPLQSVAVKKGRVFNRLHISSFSASQGIVVVYLQLFMGKQEESSWPSVFCVVLTVQCGRGMLTINVQLLPNKELNWNHICSEISLLA